MQTQDHFTITIQQVYASALVIVAVLAGHPPVLEHVSVTGWIAAGVSGVLYYAAGFWCSLTGLRRSSAPVAAGFITLIPVFGLGASYSLWTSDSLQGSGSAQQW